MVCSSASAGFRSHGACGGKREGTGPATGRGRSAGGAAGEEAPPREVRHEGARPEGPRLRLIARDDLVDERTELRRPDAHDVPDLVRESAAWGAPIVNGGEHRPDEEEKAVGVLMVGAN